MRVMTKVKYTLLKKLLLMQVTVVLLGAIAISSTFLLSSFMIARSDLENEKKQIASYLLLRADEWTAWHQVGMTNLLSEEMNEFQNQNRLKSIRFVSSQDPVSKKPNEQDLVIQILPDLWIQVELEKQNLLQLFWKQKNVVYSMLILTFFFLSVSYFSFVYLRKKVHQPIVQLIDSMKGNMSGVRDVSKRIIATDEMRVFVDEISSLFERIKTMERTSALGVITAQVTHDLMSPISSLEVFLENSSILDDEKELLSLSVSRIKNIAADLLERNRNVNGRFSGIKKNIDELIVLKNAEFSKCNFNIICEIDGLTGEEAIPLSGLEFQRMVSNLINNAYESYEGKGGVVKIKISKIESRINIRIIDFGKGMAKEILADIGNFGTSFGKAKGSGIGIYSAKELVNSIGGELNITSIRGDGTEISISLPYQI